jgi:predicted dithiol-disulfide oxidoreductase (DUF899 family)
MAKVVNTYAKEKSINLGALQTEFETARNEWEKDKAAYIKSQEQLNRSKDAFASAREALESATRTVLGQ